MTTTFETAKVGDKVWCMRRGWGKIHSINTDTEYLYPVNVEYPNWVNVVYTVDGLFSESDVTQSLFWDEVKFEAPSKPLPDLEVDTKVIVWNSSIPKTKRHFSHFNTSGKIMCFDNGMTSWTTEYTSVWGNWELAE